MRTLGMTLTLLVLAACGPTPETPTGSAPAFEVEPIAPAALTGEFIAISTTAMSLTGDLSVTPDVLSFGKGFRVEGGRLDAALEANTDLSAGGGTLADGSGIAQFQSIELRRIDNVRVAADARDPQLCGEGKTATYAILANGAETLSLQVFSGADAPGPNAHDTQLCGIFKYQPR